MKHLYQIHPHNQNCKRNTTNAQKLYVFVFVKFQIKVKEEKSKVNHL